MSDFGTRLKQALKDAHMTQQDLADALGIKQQSVQYLCSGKPTSSKYITQIAKILKTTPEYLETGNHKVSEQPPEYTANTVPLFRMNDLERGLNTAVSTTPCPLPHSQETYAFTVDYLADFNPMHATHGARAYPAGSIVFVDPTQADDCMPGDIVAAKTNKTPFTFRLLMNIDSTPTLMPLRADIFKPDTEFEIIGKIIVAILP